MGIDAVFCSRERDADSSPSAVCCKGGGPFNDVSVGQIGNQFI